jgi:hypothetical protein
MRLPLFRGPERSEEPEGEPRHLEQSSLALKGLVRVLRGVSGRPNVLDLGEAIGVNVAFFARFRARVSVADLYRSLRTARLEDALLPSAPPARFDVILLWDLLNYLTAEEISWLARSLGRLSNPGATMLAFLASSREIPHRPSRYLIRDEETLMYEVSGTKKRPSPRYTEHALLRLMPGTVVESRFQLRNETVEYLLQYRDLLGY